MKPHTIGITVIAAASLVVVLRAMVGDEPAPAAAAPPSVTASTPARIAVPMRDGTADQVRAELAALRTEIAYLQPGKPPRDNLSYEEHVALAQRRAAAEFAALESAFAADRRDPGWSPQAEGKLRDAFGAANVAGGRLEELSCGGTLCRYSVRFDSVAHREEASDAITALARWGSRGFGGPDPAEPLRFVFYVSRDRTSFPTVAVESSAAGARDAVDR